MTIDIPEAYRRALDDFGALVHRIGPDQWENPTPCVDWDVRALVNHVVGENLWAPELLAGRTTAEIGDAFEGDLLGDDPIKAFDTSAVPALQAAAGHRVLDRIVHLPFGDVPGREYITELFADALIHTWDLARAIGADERLDPELVTACATWFADAGPGYRQASATGEHQVGEHRKVPSDTDAQTRLLASWGRRA
ncbi:TIGR03086 family metal-binding protein [Streptosporangium sp. NBC_01755]|uniref:TIGR03086 family metal-binding protein n=1 Tax=unclassified Streptosporangium TaxID=2632669 RepID=UPI002DD84F42|nr:MULTISPECIES: TIGR03086 family metal-binding protein [unclassified Streptosporangium]WSA27048.1 TIGR03086 family metal-binding protein [Streptosporangium sp. NBC_01810]WSD01542.1 TIGR03086 family metal-binding protein [Streptosporangium sp. NBC_01755]